MSDDFNFERPYNEEDNPCGELLNDAYEKTLQEYKYESRFERLRTRLALWLHPKSTDIRKWEQQQFKRDFYANWNDMRTRTVVRSFRESTNQHIEKITGKIISELDIDSSESSARTGDDDE